MWDQLSGGVPHGGIRLLVSMVQKARRLTHPTLVQSPVVAFRWQGFDGRRLVRFREDMVHQPNILSKYFQPHHPLGQMIETWNFQRKFALLQNILALMI